MNNELEVVPIEKGKKGELITINEEGSVISEGKQLPALVDGSVVISSKLQTHEQLNPSYQVSSFSMNDLTETDTFDPFNDLFTLLLRQAREAMTKNDVTPRSIRVPFRSMYGFEEEQAMSLMEPRILERMASLSQNANITYGMVVQTIDSLGKAYIYEVKAPIADKKRFRLWLKLVFREKVRKKLVVTNQEELSANHQQLLEAALERDKEKPFLLDEFHQFGGVESE